MNSILHKNTAKLPELSFRSVAMFWDFEQHENAIPVYQKD